MIECSGLHAASLNAENSMHCGAMDPDCMHWSPCSVMNAWIPCSLVKCIPIECSGFHAAPLNAEDSLHFGAMADRGRRIKQHRKQILLHVADFGGIVPQAFQIGRAHV